MEKKYNFVYKTTNLINGKIYIGVHKTNDMDDGYKGSGSTLKKAFIKYGKNNFKRELLKEFDSYLEALEYERQIVTITFVEDKANYNIKTGGIQNIYYNRESKKKQSLLRRTFWSSNESTKTREHQSHSMKELWSNPEYKEHMMEKFNSSERNEKLSTNLKKWIIEHPEEHKERMNKINHNPEKIRKMVEKQTGRPKSDECKEHISKAKLGKHIGYDNPNFKGYYITPYGKFTSLKATSDAIGNSLICIRDRCVAKNKNKITKHVVTVDSKITIDMVGKTWNELGWGFEAK